MADLNIAPRGNRRKVAAPRIDLTPMVDLGFLLITFFIFTTTLAQEKALTVNMPSSEITSSPATIPEESTLTLIPARGHKVYHYEGLLTDPEHLGVCQVHETDDAVQKKKNKVGTLPASFSAEAHKLHVLIKPTKDCKYEDVVYLLDLMLIENVPYYVLMDITAEEQGLLSRMNH